jgi:arylsulfatase A-like enzyme
MRARVISVLLLLAPCGCGGGQGDVDVKDERLNVLLISLDSTRQDLLSSYGAEFAQVPDMATSPVLDRIAEQGVLFEDAYASSSWTLPSHVSLFTGVPDVVHGVDLDAHRLDDSLTTLAEVLSRHGYRTAGFYSGPYLGPSFGLGRGFERYEACYGPELTGAADRLTESDGDMADGAAALAPPDLLSLLQSKGEAELELEHASHRDVSSDYVTDAALDEIKAAAAGDEPFFVFAHYFDPHYDYIPPEPFDRRFDPDYEGSIDGTDFFSNPAISTFDTTLPSGRRRVVDERGLEHIRALYAGELAWTDSEIGRLIGGLDELGLGESTLVIIVADHGDEFFEHGGIGHRRTLFEEVVRVPLILRLPETLPAGRRVRGPVSLTGVFATVLDQIGLTELDRHGSASLLPVIEPGVSERGVLGRIVRAQPLIIRTPTQAGLLVPVQGQLITILETYRKGAVKITRERRWTKRTEDAPLEVLRAIENQSAEMRREEKLSWIDLEEHPEERPEDHSEDFSDATARAALQEFHSEYYALLQRRRVGPLGVASENVLTILQGLGYVGQDARIGAIAGDELELDPPGAAILDETD